MANSVRLGWLLHRQTQRVEIYRGTQTPEVLQAPTRLSGEDVLPDLILNCDFLWKINESF